MSYIKNEVKQGVTIHKINTNKFKTNLISIFLSVPLDRKTITYNAIIPAVLRRGTKNLNSQEKISIELENMYEILGEYPILMLDDVFSELDKDRQTRLLKFAGRTQTFITCTDDKKIDGKIFEIVAGTVVG